MDKNKIKSFAIWARRKLISSVADRARYIGLYIDSNGDFNETKAELVQGGFKLKGMDGVFKLSYKDREVLVNRIKSYEDKKKGFEQVVEEVAYTWFNRFMGLRYMEVNDYLPSGIRVLSSEVEGKTEPDVLTRVSEVLDELNKFNKVTDKQFLNPEEIYELLDSGKTEDREKAYGKILVKQCNELGRIIHQMFEEITDYTELLLPDNLLEEGSVIRKMVEDIEETDWKEEVEIIGWMYQYYISEKKDEVFADLKKNIKITKENIPAATQLFTPKWIVKYMVENSLGRLWLEGHPNEELQKEWKYYLEEAKQEQEVEEELKKIREEHSKLKPEDIKVLDPCMGSGHILVYAFDVLYEIYKNAGYSEREIPRMILQNNLYGLDIDDRAAQLASFALIMKARHYNRRLFREMERESLELNLCSIQESNGLSKEAVEYFIGENEDLRKYLEYLVEVFSDAKEYGSILEVKEIDFGAIEKRLSEIKAFEQTNSEDSIGFPIEFPLQIDIFTNKNRNIVLEKIPILVKQGRIMSKKYEVCITNPPYMANKNMNIRLSKYINKYYSSCKVDLYSVFIKKAMSFTKKYTSLITQQSWMFTSTFEDLRVDIVETKLISSLVHLGARAFSEIGGEVVQTVAFVLGKDGRTNEYIGNFIKLSSINDSFEKERQFFNDNNLFKASTSSFKGIEMNPIAYWCSEKFISVFKKGKYLKSICEPKAGLATGDNTIFQKYWFEIDYNLIGFNYKDCNETLNVQDKWFPCNSGGEHRKWYGNHEMVVEWQDDGKKIRNFKSDSGKLKSRPQNTIYYFKKGITWNKISTGNFSVRYKEEGFIFDDTSRSAFIENYDDLLLILGLLTTKLSKIILNILNPTLSYTNADISRIPVLIDDIRKNSIKILDIVRWCIKKSRDDWDSFQTSWDFKTHPCLKLLDKGEQYRLSAIFRIWETECEETFEQLKNNEEELNRLFIDIYGLQDELTPDVEDKDITIRKADRERDIKSFISYAVGCMLGRYSIDAEGLIYAGGDFKDKWNLEDKKVRKIETDEEGNIISDSWVEATLLPDGDNVILITEDEYFEDDIVSRFIDFVRTVYSDETLEENLDFIADSIGRKPSETARQAIRIYFIKGFYKDHLKVYKKRPIYWMFESGKNDGFKALVYMHRYNEQTVAKVRTDYLHTLQRKYEAEMQRQQLIVDSEEYTIKDRTVAKKKIDRISKQIEECREYDQVVAHLANEKISIDLDDGVKVNYEKFQGVKVINSKEKEVKMDLLANIK
ncbi:BREX-1 system adenine-specific DNA-methyltransferase PglX [Clostridium sp. FP2]|uniref:BREX-1 system adenine-specific DNA-methyltransferase PglX n=1 Tax=Clostridium sp. FP2 TaxID=2724481 RepID=UPI0013E92103|nr:BREX-1 system adenine-specific DNA-methyltransferase PglX [Clostridium sp. FP2]MBZ9624737.1 BREX-1 system adenine-specific DNA-methyltransferase PglX [Clostridium sp. FP2]